MFSTHLPTSFVCFQGERHLYRCKTFSSLCRDGEPLLMKLKPAVCNLDKYPTCLLIKYSCSSTMIVGLFSWRTSFYKTLHSRIFSQRSYSVFYYHSKFFSFTSCPKLSLHGPFSSEMLLYLYIFTWLIWIKNIPCRLKLPQSLVFTWCFHCKSSPLTCFPRYL